MSWVTPRRGSWVKTAAGTCVTELRSVPEGLCQIGTPSWGAEEPEVLGWLLRSPLPASQDPFCPTDLVYLFRLIKQDSLDSGWEQAKCIVLLAFFLAFLGWVWSRSQGWAWEVGRGSAQELACCLSPGGSSFSFPAW